MHADHNVAFSAARPIICGHVQVAPNATMTLLRPSAPGGASRPPARDVAVPRKARARREACRRRAGHASLGTIVATTLTITMRIEDKC